MGFWAQFCGDWLVTKIVSSINFKYQMRNANCDDRDNDDHDHAHCGQYNAIRGWATKMTF